MRPEWLAVVSSSIKRLFHVLTITLLGLLLPLSFLLLARLSFVNFTSSLPPPSSSSHPSLHIPFPLSLFFHPKSLNPVHAIVSLFCLSVLLHCLTGWTLFLAGPPPKTTAGGYHRLGLAWALLCTMHVSVGLGIEGSLATGIGSLQHLDSQWSTATRAVVFLGMHETMVHWYRAVVRPVVDDTVYGADGGIRRWPEKAALAAAYGGLWWWKLRDEVESMITIPLVKKEMRIGLEMVDFGGWWLYYLTATIGMIRAVRAVLWAASRLVSRRVGHKVDGSIVDQDIV
ncbi:hypothetical protein SAY87_004397 [Trapa incisa]|uniref:Transmembrane protein n=1 Tax=Trapa incisa TaxID=236973 RepID=A0AAN7JNS6_9MYRT|nr:hypothetical protein SAY87_004397 [Trapa incisa]